MYMTNLAPAEPVQQRELGMDVEMREIVRRQHYPDPKRRATNAPSGSSTKFVHDPSTDR